MDIILAIGTACQVVLDDPQTVIIMMKALAGTITPENAIHAMLALAPDPEAARPIVEGMIHDCIGSGI